MTQQRAGLGDAMVDFKADATTPTPYQRTGTWEYEHGQWVLRRTESTAPPLGGTVRDF